MLDRTYCESPEGVEKGGRINILRNNLRCT
jgi:hypothetical protein